MLESNDKRAAAMAAFEGGYSDLEATEPAGFDNPENFLDSLREITNAVAENLREAGEMWREAASNIEDGFGHPTSMSEEFESYADDVDGVADEVEGLVDELNDPAEDDEDFASWADEKISDLIAALGDCEGNLP